MAPVRATESPQGFIDIQTDKRVILSDFGVVIDIPEVDPRPYTTLDAALLVDQKYTCKRPMLDGTESLVLYFQNYDMLKSTLKGNVMVNMPLPLKNRSAYKQEVDGGVLL
eukprot:scaffold669_cov152-Isochrysis_galbana.AAC.5